MFVVINKVNLDKRAFCFEFVVTDSFTSVLQNYVTKWDMALVFLFFCEMTSVSNYKYLYP